MTIRQDLFLASVSLIEALGGGWDTTLTAHKKELEKDFSFLPQLPPNGAGAADSRQPVSRPQLGH